MKREGLLMLGEVAQYFGVCKATVRNWVNKGKLKAIVTPGGHRRIRKEDFDEFIKKYKGFA